MDKFSEKVNTWLEEERIATRVLCDALAPRPMTADEERIAQQIRSGRVRLLTSNRYLSHQKLGVNEALYLSEPDGFGNLDLYGYRDCWYFLNLGDCIEQMFEWDGMPGTEPTGWWRNSPTGRRRPNGDPDLEYVHW